MFTDMFFPRTRRVLDRTFCTPRSATCFELVQLLLILFTREEAQCYEYEQISASMQATDQEQSEYRQKQWKLAHGLGSVVPEMRFESITLRNLSPPFS